MCTYIYIYVYIYIYYNKHCNNCGTWSRRACRAAISSAGLKRTGTRSAPIAMSIHIDRPYRYILYVHIYIYIYIYTIINIVIIVVPGRVAPAVQPSVPPGSCGQARGQPPSPCPCVCPRCPHGTCH